MNAWLAVFKKEMIDAGRDRKTLLSVFFSAIAIGPLMLVLISTLVSQIDESRDRRVVLVSGIEYAPELRNFFERQTYSIEAAPLDFEAKLKASKLGDPVLIVPSDFQEKLNRGETPVIEIVSDSTNRPAEVGSGRLHRLLNGFMREQSTMVLAQRGVAADSLKVVDYEDRDLASSSSRAAQLTSMLPTFIIMAILYGALNAALDTSAGERERGSLEPLLMNPTPRSQLVIGKWAAVASVGMLIAVLTVLSFFPSQLLIRSETVKAMFQFGWTEALAFMLVLIPFAAALAAVFMAVSIRCKSFKEAHASNTVVIVVLSLLPLVTFLNPNGEQAWYYWIPGLAQQTVMNRVLKGEDFNVFQVVAPTVICGAITVMCLVFVTRQLRQAAIR